ncbi:MAG: hypothetical protein M3256_25475 [Actinomycetota bacterium]|nr:hypothetical protein [Actinomycetota bacterium]
MEDVATRFKDLEATREPLYWYLNMRRAGTMGGPFLLRRLSDVGGEPGPLVFVGEGSYPTGVLLIPFEAVESFDMGPAAKASPFDLGHATEASPS